MPADRYVLQHFKGSALVFRRSFNSAIECDLNLESIIKDVAARHGVSADSLDEHITWDGAKPICGETRCGDEWIVWDAEDRPFTKLERKQAGRDALRHRGETDRGHAFAALRTAAALRRNLHSTQDPEVRERERDAARNQAAGARTVLGAKLP